MGADRASLHECWSQLFSTEEGQELRRIHLVLATKSMDELSRCVPVTLHEDAGPFSKANGVNACTWHPLLGVGTDLEQKKIYYTELSATGACTCVAAWEKFFAAFDALASGKDMDGNYVAEDADGFWSFTLLFGKADLEKFARWGLPSYGDGEEICGVCTANRSSRPWSDLRSFVEYRRHNLANEQQTQWTPSLCK